jgi:hypothetical protein
MKPDWITSEHHESAFARTTVSMLAWDRQGLIKLR